MMTAFMNGLISYYTICQILTISLAHTDDFTPSTLHLSQSIAKSVTSSLCGTFTIADCLDTHQLVTEYLPCLNQTEYRGATVQHLLDMYSGIAYSEDYEDPTSGVSMTEYASGWKKPPTEISHPKTIHEQILTMNTLESEHGTQWKYRTIESEVLGWCLESATGKTLADLVTTEIWEVSNIYKR